MNNLGRGPLRDVPYIEAKLYALWFQTRRIVLNSQGGAIFGPRGIIYFLRPCSLAEPVLAGRVYAFVVLCPGTPEGSTGSGSGFKASQKTGNGLKSHPSDWEKPGIEPATPGA